MTMTMTTITGPTKGGLGLLTPETTLKRAANLNNAFLRLEPATRANPKFGAAFTPVFNGWSTYYARLKGSYLVRLTEYGEIEKWEKQYIKLRTALKAAGAKVATAPIVIAAPTPGTVPETVQVVPTPETEKKLTRITGALTFLGVAAAAWGTIWFFSRRR